MRTFGGALAHSKKRRDIYTREDYFEVVYACQRCHFIADNMTHEEMHELITGIIAKRENR